MINKIQTNSALAVVVALASTLIGSSASANIVCFQGDIDTLLAQDSVICGDKLFNNFAFDALFNTPTEQVTIGNNQLAAEGPEFGNFIFQYQGALNITTAQMASFSYDVTINDPLIPEADRIENAQFDGVALGLDIDGLAAPIDAVKEVSYEGDGGTPLTVNDGEAKFFPVGVTKISVMDTLTFSAGSQLDSISNDFSQIQRSPNEPIPVPEPGTIIGLLALGGLGLATKGKKQK
ncbi:MAG: PEP-CTERM sorting domain-containing protein [Crocosphaera sp.]